MGRNTLAPSRRGVPTPRPVDPASGRDRLVAIFLALLFLARERSVELRQEVLGSSPILVVRTAESRKVVVEEP